MQINVTCFTSWHWELMQSEIEFPSRTLGLKPATSSSLTTSMYQHWWVIHELLTVTHFHWWPARFEFKLLQLFSAGNHSFHSPNFTVMLSFRTGWLKIVLICFRKRVFFSCTLDININEKSVFNFWHEQRWEYSCDHWSSLLSRKLIPNYELDLLSQLNAVKSLKFPVLNYEQL